MEIYFSPPPVSHRTRSMGQHPQYRIVFSWSAKSPRRERERENKSVDAVHSPAVFLFSYPFCLSIFVEIYCWPQPVSHRTRSTARHLGPIQFSLVKILGRSMKALFDPSNHLIFVSARLIFIFFLSDAVGCASDTLHGTTPRHHPVSSSFFFNWCAKKIARKKN